jgi:hypothetical protein
MRTNRFFVIIFATTILSVAAQSPCGATSLTITGAAVYTDTEGNYTITAVKPTLVTGAINAGFQSAFNSWNDDPSGGDGVWHLVNGGALGADTKFDVSTYIAHVTPGGFGDLKIQIDYTAGAGAPPPIPASGTPSDTSAVWSQSVATNQKLAGSLPGNPYLDNPSTAPNPTLGPPAYSYQYATSYFFDDPGRNSYATWMAVAYISTVNYSTDTVTVYDGVAYGFTVVPEPSSLVMGLLGAILAPAGIRMSRKRAIARDRAVA